MTGLSVHQVAPYLIALLVVAAAALVSYRHLRRHGRLQSTFKPADGDSIECHLCGYEYPRANGRYGCPNCLGEGLDWLPGPDAPTLADGQVVHEIPADAMDAEVVTVPPVPRDQVTAGWIAVTTTDGGVLVAHPDGDISQTVSQKRWERICGRYQ